MNLCRGFGALSGRAYLVHCKIYGLQELGV